MAETKKTLLEKINQIKLGLSQADLKQTGKNTHYNWGYTELNDFLPQLIKLMSETRVLSKFDFPAVEGEPVKLTIFDIDSSDKLEYTSPMSTADLKGAHKVQNLGAVQTYLRRYMYMFAFDVVARDVLDQTMDKKQTPHQAKKVDIEEAFKILRSCSSIEDLKTSFELLKKQFTGGELDELIAVKDEIKIKYAS
jgi:hypothetical protein